MQSYSRAIGTPEPSGASCVSSPGTIPRLHTLNASARSSNPAPCTPIHTVNIPIRMSTVISGKRMVGFSSESGIIYGDARCECAILSGTISKASKEFPPVWPSTVAPSLLHPHYRYTRETAEAGVRNWARDIGGGGASQDNSEDRTPPLTKGLGLTRGP